MRKLIYFATVISLLLTVFTLRAQDKTCSTTLDLAWMQANDPEHYQRFVDLENFTASYNNQNARLINGNGLIVIPVVVHVLHRGEQEGTGLNISMTQIQSQIDQLNKDYRRLNDDRVNTPLDFLPIASDFTIEFRLACLDPNGNPTNGVVRKYAGIETYNPNRYRPNGTKDDDLIGIKVSSTGDAAWPTDRYLNIWVCNMIFDFGYSTFPIYYSTYPQYDGVVIRTTAFGTTGNVLPPTNLGRTATHEIGHWLNILHLNGDGFCGDDFVGDTPAEQTIEMRCRDYPSIYTRCNPSDPSTMFMNFLEWTPDDCMNLFTNGQRTRARAIFATILGRGLQLNGFFGFAGQPTTINCRGTLTVTSMCVPVTWNVTAGPAHINNGQGSNKAEIVATGSGSVHVTVSWSNYTAETDISVTTNPPPQPGPITIVLIDYYIGKIQVEINPVPGASSYNWYKNGVLQTPSQGEFAQISITRNRCNVSYAIEVEAVNDCGASAKTYKGVYVPCDNSFKISPNPTTNSLTVFTDATKIAEGAYSSFDGVKVYDLQGNLKVYQQFNKVNSATINVMGLFNGTYIVEISSGAYKERQQLIIQK